MPDNKAQHSKNTAVFLPRKDTHQKRVKVLSDLRRFRWVFDLKHKRTMNVTWVFAKIRPGNLNPNSKRLQVAGTGSHRSYVQHHNLPLQEDD